MVKSLSLHFQMEAGSNSDLPIAITDLSIQGIPSLAIFDACPVALVVTGRDGNISLFNKAAENLFGYNQEELLGKSVGTLIPERYRDVHPSKIQQFFNNPGRREMGTGRDVYAVDKHGREFPVEIGLNPVETREGMFVLAAIVDLTERKKLEQLQRNLNQELEQRIVDRSDEINQVNIALDNKMEESKQFAYITAHDLQTPLRAVSSFSRFLQNDFSGQLDEVADEYIERIAVGCEKIKTLLDHMLDYFGIEEGSHSPEAVDMSLLAKQVKDSMKSQAKECSAKITFSRLPSVLADPEQISRLLEYILENAIDFQSEAPPEIHISALGNGKEWIFSVKDNGIGIPPDKHEQIFLMFRRLQKKPGHSGVGLALCKKIIQGNGGMIWVESEPGQGSTFYYTLPAL